MYRELRISRFGSYLRNNSRYFNSVKSTGFLALIPTFWPYLHVSISIDKGARAISVIFSNDVIAAAILNILKLLIFLNDNIDIGYVQFKFQADQCIIYRVEIMAETLNFGNDVIVAAILNF